MQGARWGGEARADQRCDGDDLHGCGQPGPAPGLRGDAAVGHGHARHGHPGLQRDCERGAGYGPDGGSGHHRHGGGRQHADRTVGYAAPMAMPRARTPISGTKPTRRPARTHCPSLVSGASYDITTADPGKFLVFEVTPHSASGDPNVGTAVLNVTDTAVAAVRPRRGRRHAPLQVVRRECGGDNRTAITGATSATISVACDRRVLGLGLVTTSPGRYAPMTRRRLDCPQFTTGREIAAAAEHSPSRFARQRKTFRLDRFSVTS